MAFWSTTSGVVTGVAGTLTGAVGIATLAAQMGWIGADGDKGDQASPATEQAPAEVAEDTGLDGADEAPAPDFAVAPASVRFEALGPRTATVTVRNAGDAEVRVEDVGLAGEDQDRFTVAAAPCTASTLDPGRSCEVEVSYAPGGGSARATLVVEVHGAAAQEVPLTAPSLL